MFAVPCIKMDYKNYFSCSLCENKSDFFMALKTVKGETQELLFLSLASYLTFLKNNAWDNLPFNNLSDYLL